MKKDDPEEVRIPIRQVLEYYGSDDIKDDMGWHNVRCPFHGDSNKSASVNTDIHIFRCHACDMRGNAAQLIMKKEGMEYAAAYRRATELAGEGNSPVHGESSSRWRLSGKASNKRGSSRYRRSWGG